MRLDDSRSAQRIDSEGSEVIPKATTMRELYHKFQILASQTVRLRLKGAALT